MVTYGTEWVWGAWLSWIFPIIGAILTPLLAKISTKLRDYAAVFFSFLAAAMTATMLPMLLEPRLIQNEVSWISIPGSPILSEVKAGVMVDPLNVIMANIVAVISFLIMVYSLGYMHGDPSLTRYWFFMNFFIGNMLLLVMSNNLIQMLFGWEGVGLCSYALIGFWFRDSKEDWLKCWVGEEPEAYPPSHAGLKAFITTRIGDVSLLIGAFMILAFAGTLNFVELQNGAINRVPVWILVPASILLFGGPIGKSAQLPLMEWLPDAMAGPTTVSALIHAATMVKAGVFLVGRVFPIFYVAAWHAGSPNELVNFFYAIAWIGAITAFVAATQAMPSREIKKVLAYSTVSQLGYMMLALGVAGLTAEFAIGYAGGIFHLMSHAIFKAALFLTAGAVIHACKSRFMTDMGGIRKDMPITFWSMTLTAFSLMGVPIVFSGFWSKDMVLEAPLIAGQFPIFILAVVTVALTSFYSIRMLGLTFLGGKSRNPEMHGRVHEAPAVMWVPYVILAAATIGFGLAGLHLKDWFEELFSHYLSGIAPMHVTEIEAGLSITEASLVATAGSLVMLVVGLIPAYLLYIRRRPDPTELLSRRPILSRLWSFLFRRWYINRLYYAVIVYPSITVSRWILRNIELGAIDRFNYALATGARILSTSFRRTHTGILTYNVVAMLLGIAILLVLLIGVTVG